MNAIDSIQPFTTAYRELAAGRESNLHALGERAMQAFSETGFPTVKDEHWKYTSLRKLVAQAYVLVPSAPLVDSQTLAAFEIDPGAARIVFVNGQPQFDLSRLPSADSGITVNSLAQTLASDSASVALGELVNLQRYRMAALNTAFVQDGVHVQATPSGEQDSVLHLLFLSSREYGPAAAAPRVLVDALAGSNLAIIEHYASLDTSAALKDDIAPDGCFTNAVTELHVHANACVTHYKLQEDPGYHIASIHARLQRDARLHSHNLALGAALARTDIQVDLAAPGSEVSLNGLVLGTGRQHVDNHTRVEHLQPNTQSAEDYRSVLDDRARCVFNGKVLVHKDAQKIQADQSSTNLLLSRHAEIDTKPELEIYADDVRCSHGATVGQLDEQSLFYLRARGMDLNQARAVLTFAFLRDLLGQVHVSGLRQRVEQAVLRRLPGQARLGELL